MSARRLYLVAYDVACPRRRRQVQRLLLAYRVGGQKSFVECWLTPAERRTVLGQLTRLIDVRHDRGHAFSLDPRMAMHGLGIAVLPAPTCVPFLIA